MGRAVGLHSYGDGDSNWIPIKVDEQGRVVLGGDVGGGSAPMGIDSTGAALPSSFDNYSEAYGYTGDDLTTITRTGAGGTYTQTLTYADGKLTNTSMWVKA